MSRQKYNEWCRSVECKLIQPWSIIKEGSNENDSWGKVSIRADDSIDSNPEMQDRSIDSSNSVEQKSFLQQVSLGKNG